MTDAKDIQLTKGMLKILRQLTQGKSIAWSSIKNTAEAQSLYYFSLIYVSRNGNFAQITEKGRQALLHHENGAKDRKDEHLHNWLIAIFSTIGGALLSKPIWAALEWVAEMITRTN